MGTGFCSFKSKVIVLGVGAALVPILILGILSYQSQKRIINNEFSVLLSSLVSESAEQVSRWLAERRSEIDMLARTPNLRDETMRLSLSVPSQEDAAGAQYRVRQSLLRQSLELIVLGYRWVIEASIVDPRTGRVLISTNDARYSNPVIPPSDLDRIVKGSTVLSPVYASPEPFANDTGQMEQGMPTMSISAPILFGGQVPGILNLRLDVQAMKQEFFGGTRFFAASGLRSLDLYLVNGDGVFLSPSAFEGALLAEGRIRRRSVLELAAQVPHTHLPTEAVRACRGLQAGEASPSSNLDGYIGYRGIPVVGTWTPVSGTDWCVLAEVERAETLAPVTHLLKITLFVFLGIGGIFALLAVWLSSTLTTPLIRLTALATRMAGGDRSVRFGMKRTDEIGQLAASFDQMAATIEQQVAELEHKVQERTANLLAADRQQKGTQQRLLAQYATTRVLAESETLNDAIPRILEAICSTLGWDVGLFWTVDRRDQVLRCADVWMHEPSRYPEFAASSHHQSFPSGLGLPGLVWRDAKPFWVEDLTADTRFPRATVAAAEGLRAGFGFPVLMGQEVVGVMEFFCRQVRQPDEDVLGMLAATGGQVGQFIGRVTVQEALHEREEQLRQAQKMEAVGRLAGGIAHDFNNLLTAIMGYSQLLLRKLSEDHPLRRYAVEIHQGGERASRLTGQLLAFSRKQVLQPKVLDLNAILTGLTLMLRRLLGEQIHMETRLAADLGMVKADPGQIEQVILNLVVNARDAMAHGGRMTIETANVTLDELSAAIHGEVKAGDYVLLSVTDTGCGMEPDTLQHIFEPFFTTKGRDKGTGLGLATVYGIVRQSGGGVEVMSKPGSGSTFVIYLPRAVETVPRPVVTAVTGPLAGSETVLLVEDEDAVRSLAAQVLDQHGFKVLEARNGEEALAAAERWPGKVHLLVTDVVMPGMSGPEVAERLGKRQAELRVLYISGYTDNAINDGTVLEAGTGYLQKPFSTDALLHKVRSILDATAHTTQG